MKQTHFIICSLKGYLTLALMGSVGCYLTFSLFLYSETFARAVQVFQVSHTFYCTDLFLFILISLLIHNYVHINLFDYFTLLHCYSRLQKDCLTCTTALLMNLFTTNDHIPPSLQNVEIVQIEQVIFPHLSSKVINIRMGVRQQNNVGTIFLLLLGALNIVYCMCLMHLLVK